MKTPFLVITLGAALGAGAWPLLAHPAGETPGGRWKERMERRADALGLTEAQRDQVRAVMKENRPALEPLMKQAAGERRAMHALVTASPVNEDAIRAQAAKSAAAAGELAVLRARLRERIRAILTPEQREKADAATDRWEARMEARREQLGNGGDGR